MQKQPKIAWRESQQQKLSRSVAKFNAKITRELKKNPELQEFLPTKLNAKELRQSIQTAKDLNALTKSIDRAFKPQAFTPIQTEKGVKTTKFEVKETQLKVNKINRARASERKQANPSTERGTMGTIRSNNLLPKKFNLEKMSKKEWEKFVVGVEKEVQGNYKSDKMEIYKQNYLQAINQFLGDDGGELYSFVSELSAEFIYENYYNDPILQIGFTSDPLPVGIIAETALDHWKQALADN